MAIRVVSLRDWDIAGIVEGIRQPNMRAVVYFFSQAFEEHEPHKAIANAFPSASCIGASMLGGWSSSGAVGHGIVAMSFSADEVDDVCMSFQEGVGEDPTGAAKAAIAELKQKTEGKNINPDEYLGLIFFKGTCLGELIMKEFSLEQDLNMAFVGGAAGTEQAVLKTQVSVGDRISDDGLAAAILKMNIPFFFNHYVHYLPTNVSFTISKAEAMKRIVWEINGEPAAAFYARILGINNVADLSGEILSRNPVGLMFGGSVYARSPTAVVDGVGLAFSCCIEAGTKVHLLTRGDIISNAENILFETKQFLSGNIQGGLLFNCASRYLELVELGKVDAFNDVFKHFPMIGFNSFGEELFIHHNQTLTAVFFGAPLRDETADPYKAKRLFHYTDSKLKAMVFDVISRNERLDITISHLNENIEKHFLSLSSQSSCSGLCEKIAAEKEEVRENLSVMLEQSRSSKDDIKKMLVVYQNNMEKTGKYVFNIADEIRYQNWHLMELREQAETASRTKSNFLASMSHEIRTPMNAITGMAELLLRGELSNESRGYAQDIKQAAANLLSIINDLLDFSKIEAGKLEIIPTKYLLASLINDVVSIIRMRLVEKPIRFYTNIDGQIPNSLIGDEVRLRQIFINLLANAVQYTEKGHIGFSMAQERRTDDKIWLRITVSDTGRGIKPEDQSKLFDDFVQVDTKKNRTIEGTGLGLPIVKRLCTAMGGDTIVTSEYGQGSSFTVLLPQEIDSQEPFAMVNEPEKKKVLVFERRVIYTQSICWSLDNMKVPHVLVNDMETFAEALAREEWYFIFSSYGLYNKIKPMMNRPDADFPGGKRPSVALMVEWGIEAYIPNVRFVSIPVQSMSISNILNGQADRRDYFESPGAIQYVFPKARLLVVDDISTNLRVTQGLLAPYKVEVDVCLTGQEAIELVKQRDYDIVFMDHMMPEMDGMEATAIIREWEKERMYQEVGLRPLPIVALTANAVSGMRELFLEKGFSDFLAKPVDVSKLDETLERWIRKEKRERNRDSNSGSSIVLGLPEGTSLPIVPGIDVVNGIAKTGGTLEGYRQVLSTFRKDVEDRLPLLQAAPDTQTLPLFVTHVHALKSAAASLGAREISETAARLEIAGRAGNTALIAKNLDTFAGRLAKLAEDIDEALRSPGAWETTADQKNAEPETPEDISARLTLLRELSVVLKSQNVPEMYPVIEKLGRQKLDAITKTTLDKVSDDMLMAEFDNAAKTIDAFLAANE